MERVLPIFDLTPEVLDQGLRMWDMLLPHNATARRVKYAVADFPDNPDDL